MAPTKGKVYTSFKQLNYEIIKLKGVLRLADKRHVKKRNHSNLLRHSGYRSICRSAGAGPCHQGMLPLDVLQLVRNGPRTSFQIALKA